MFRSVMASHVVVAVAVLMLAGAARGAYKPWDDMTADSWIFGNSTPAPRMYAANSSVEYRVAFSPRKNNGGARGMNGMRFNAAEGANHVTSDLAGSFTVMTMGGENYSALLILVAIGADHLPGDFAFALAGHTFDPAEEFIYYDSADYDTGRPTGYYSQTDPTAEPVSYMSPSGMVSIVGSAACLSLGALHSQLPTTKRLSCSTTT